MRIKWLITIVISLCIFQTNAQRSYLSLNDNWQFRFSHQVGKNSTGRFSLPHTWNAPDYPIWEIRLQTWYRQL